MRTGTRETARRLSQSESALRQMCALLGQWKNAEPAAHAELCGWLRKWQGSPSLADLLGDDPALTGDVCRATLARLEASGAGQRSSFCCEGDDLNRGDAHDKAVWLFTCLIANPDYHKLKPCAHCGNYFVQHRASQAYYCSRACAQRGSTAKLSQQKLRQEHQQKLERARAAMRRCKLERGSLAWKRRVALRAGVTLAWITRALNQGEL